MFLLDTNVVSELMRDKRAHSVAAFIGAKPAASLYTSTITQAEVLFGIRLLAAGKRRALLEQIGEAIFREDFAGRVLPFGGDAARAFATIAAERRRGGRPISQLDAQIAAIAHASGATLVTRNVGDFERCGIDLIDPWEV